MLEPTFSIMGFVYPVAPALKMMISAGYLNV
jgi:hypothetical protein